MKALCSSLCPQYTPQLTVVPECLIGVGVDSKELRAARALPAESRAPVGMLICIRMS
jgi:hypothetical protein